MSGQVRQEELLAGKEWYCGFWPLSPDPCVAEVAPGSERDELNQKIQAKIAAERQECF